MKTHLLMIGMLSLGMAKAGPDIISVGTDQFCDHNNIQDALNEANEDYVAVTTQKTFRELLHVDSKTLTLVGGFEDCTAAELGQIINSKTVISGDLNNDGQGDGSVLTLTGNGNVGLFGLKLMDGKSNTIGGGIRINKVTGKVNLKNLLVMDNWAGFGGGVGITDSIGVTVEIDEGAYLINNTSNLAGGGLYCDGETSVTMKTHVVNAGISNNTSNHSGGGVYLNNGCDMTFRAGRLEPGFLDFRGISGNQAKVNGGGVAINNSAKLHLSPMPGHTVNISENIADSDLSGTGVGGGVYVTGDGSQFSASNSYLALNQAVNGGGVYVSESGLLEWFGTGIGCVKANRCSHIKDNRASGKGGGVFVTGPLSEVKLLRTAFEFNRADFGTAVFADQDASVDVDYSLFTRNGNNGNNGYADIGVIQVHNDARADIKHATIADNLAETAVFITDLSPFIITLFNSIVHDPSSGLVADLSQQQANDFHAFCVMFHEDSGLYGDDVMVQDPHFKNPQSRDYRVNGLISGAVDECFELSEYTTDILGSPTGWNDPNVMASGGVYDMGAFESYDGDVIFMSGLDE